MIDSCYRLQSAGRCGRGVGLPVSTMMLFPELFQPHMLILRTVVDTRHAANAN